MITFVDWLPLATVGLTFTILGSIKLWGLKRGIVGGADKPFAQRLCGHLTHLGEPQFAAGLSTSLPWHRSRRTWLARMGAVLREMIFGSIRTPSPIATSFSVLFWAVA